MVGEWVVMVNVVPQVVQWRCPEARHKLSQVSASNRHCMPFTHPHKLASPAPLSDVAQHRADLHGLHVICTSLALGPQVWPQIHHAHALQAVPQCIRSLAHGWGNRTSRFLVGLKWCGRTLPRPDACHACFPAHRLTHPMLSAAPGKFAWRRRC